MPGAPLRPHGIVRAFAVPYSGLSAEAWRPEKDPEGYGQVDYEAVIGLEVHAQLRTSSKMFCGCSAAYQEMEPNTVVCPVCMGMPGVLPVPNGQAVEHVVRTGLALGCTIATQSKFDRKNYPYPDLMKGYQISQHNLPIASGGRLVVESSGGEREVGINRVHLEEDVAKLLHRSDGSGTYSLLDINRSGVPLMEIVSEPDMRTAEEAHDYLTRLRSILRYIGASTANMEEGSFRCDANVSMRPSGTSEFGPKVEIKNMNSFKSVYSALTFEMDRQTEIARSGGRIVQETRGWADDRGLTFSQRSKEDAHDYRYFPEPDIPPFVIDPDWVSEIERGMPELPAARKVRFEDEYGLSPYEAGLLTASPEMADYFEREVDSANGPADGGRRSAKSASNWLLGEFSRLVNSAGIKVSEVKVPTGEILALQGLVDDGTLNSSMAKAVFAEMFESGQSASQVARALGMVQISDVDAVQAAVDQAVDSNPKAVADYLGGKGTALRFLVGQVMKLTRGKANPKVAADLLEKRLESPPDR